MPDTVYTAQELPRAEAAWYTRGLRDAIHVLREHNAMLISPFGDGPYIKPIRELEALAKEAEPMRYRKKPVVIDATQWFKNGDHPDDYAHDVEVFENGELRTFTGAERKAREWEGAVVRYFRRPDVPGAAPCKHCDKIMHVHGWIDTLEGGHIVCPGDFVITGVKGERYPCKPDIFEATYEPAVDPRGELAQGVRAIVAEHYDNMDHETTLLHLRNLVMGDKDFRSGRALLAILRLFDTGEVPHG